MSTHKLVPVHFPDSDLEAQEVCQLLHDASIFCQLEVTPPPLDDFSTLRHITDRKTTIMVREDDAVRAHQIIRETDRPRFA